MAPEAAAKETANSRWRGPLAHSSAFNCADARVGDSVISYRTVSLESAPRRRGPEAIVEIDDAGVTVRSRGQTTEVARFCVSCQVEPRDLGTVGFGPGFGKRGCFGKRGIRPRRLVREAVAICFRWGGEGKLVRRALRFRLRKRRRAAVRSCRRLPCQFRRPRLALFQSKRHLLFLL